MANLKQIRAQCLFSALLFATMRNCCSFQVNVDAVIQASVGFKASAKVHRSLTTNTWIKSASVSRASPYVWRTISDANTQSKRDGKCDSAARRYWDGMNRRDVDFALAQFSDDIFFQDMMFREPFTNKQQLRQHFERCLSGFPDGLVFVIDEISVDSGDGRCGAYWHCETPDGRAFPFSRGLSFYKCNADGLLTFAREIPEPAAKPGDAGLALARFGAALMALVPPTISFPKI